MLIIAHCLHRFPGKNSREITFRKEDEVKFDLGSDYANYIQATGVKCDHTGLTKIAICAKSQSGAL